MKKTTLLLFFFAAFMFMHPGTMEAQNKDLELALFLGGSAYEGDVHCFDDAELSYFSDMGITFGLGVRKPLSNVLGLGLNYKYVSLSGDDRAFSVASGHPGRAFNFSNNLHELTGVLDFEPFGNKKYDENGNFRSIFSPYVYAGLGMAFGSANTDYNKASQSFDVQEKIGVDERDASGSHFTVPFGAGIKYYASERFSIGLDIGFRVATSDYLDGVKVSGNPDANDYYGMGGLTVAFKLGGDKKEAEEEIAELEPEDTWHPPADSDGDGVVDNEDNCPNEAGPSFNNGCPEGDADGDGIVDRLDNCPNDVGPEINGGCPDTDTDGDGIVDRLDRCPDEAGVAEEMGCPEKVVVVVDTDKDGYPDEVDKCPNVFSLVNNGCPEEKTDRLTNFTDRIVRFDNNSDVFVTESQRLLEDLVTIMANNPDLSLRITGYTDSRGSEIANQALSERRAKQVFNYLVSRGVDRNRMSYVGYGEASPMATNETEEGRALNRRVVIELITK